MTATQSTQRWRDRLGPYGVWARRTHLSPDIAREVEAIGYGSVWIGGAQGDLELAEAMLAATESLIVATGIINVWTEDAETVAAAYHRVASRFPGRFLLGVGAGHREAVGDAYERPLDVVAAYLDRLDELNVPVRDRVLAALGPRALRLARDRSAGAHPYLIDVEHTRRARAELGSDALLAPEHKVVLGADPGHAVAAHAVELYLGLSNYTNNLRRLGYTDEDLTAPGSDRLLDAIVFRGTPAAVAARLAEHRGAGADHVTVQLLGEGDALVAGLRELGAALGLTRGARPVA
jgi:probable F420-dependent oxidoreductase